MGFFDGVHVGHAALLELAKLRASETGAEPAVLTFDNHPDLFVRGGGVELLNSARDRDYILRRFFGIDRVFYIHFNAETMRMDWRVFLDRVVEKYNAAHFVAGYDFRFGSRGEGTPEKLRAYCAGRGLGCDVAEAVLRNGAAVSSTRIREKLRLGELAEANALLGHPHLLTDRVRSGFRLGRTMDFPTVNMRFSEGVLVPRYGVYASRVLLPEGPRYGVTNIGVRPTFDDSGAHVTVETNILDYDADLYGQRLCVELHSFLRPERPFASAGALKAQIALDAEQARTFFQKRSTDPRYL